MTIRSRLVAALLIAASLSAVVGCTGQISNADSNAPTAQQIVYPLSADEADRALVRAMASAFPGAAVSPVDVPNRGYTTTISFLLDSDRITATAVPNDGIIPSGAKVSGFSFAVFHSGTMPLSASTRSAVLFEAINREAAAIRPPLPIAPR